MEQCLIPQVQRGMICFFNLVIVLCRGMAWMPYFFTNSSHHLPWKVAHQIV